MQAIPPYKLPIFESKNSPPGMITADSYVTHYLAGSRLTSLIGCVQIFPLCCFCTSQEADVAHQQRNIPMLAAKLDCIGTWNTVMFILNIIGAIFNGIYVALILMGGAFEMLIWYIPFLVYYIINSILWKSQMDSNTIVKRILPTLGGGSPAPFIGGNGYAPAPQGYNAPYQAPPQVYQAPPQAYHAPPQAYQAPPQGYQQAPNNQGFSTPFN